MPCLFKLSMLANIPKNVSTADVFVLSLTWDEKTQLKTKTYLFLHCPSAIKVPTRKGKKQQTLALLLEFSTYIFAGDIFASLRAYFSLSSYASSSAELLFRLSNKIRDTVSKDEVYTVSSIEEGRAARKSPH
jgi:hypothetical protein